MIRPRRGLPELTSGAVPRQAVAAARIPLFQRAGHLSELLGSTGLFRAHRRPTRKIAASFPGRNIHFLRLKVLRDLIRLKQPLSDKRGFRQVHSQDMSATLLHRPGTRPFVRDTFFMVLTCTLNWLHFGILRSSSFLVLPKRARETIH